MVNVITTAAELGYLRIPDQTLIEIDQVKNYPDEQVVLITTGSQGESMAALSRMAANIHKKIVIKPNDTIIFSSNPIPGNEKSVSRVINELSAKGAEVIFQDAHVSGHACQEELKLMQGFPKDYIINRDYNWKSYPVAKQVARIGNSVVPIMAQKLVEANCPYLKVGERVPNLDIDDSQEQLRFA